ncbi:expressed unknown protein [Seminavis robusta]|uniref:Uncharacterized protein n=1 Tax=Seminavis robusta TaxID=568900 RepID=A0A9N8EEZ2_9STRA|nr:expressed unknown protein [Seminavis robusta]|eukprot:Sro1087_g239870.1 n/a (621) ;mRNA; f:26769-28631
MSLKEMLPSLANDGEGSPTSVASKKMPAGERQKSSLKAALLKRQDSAHSTGGKKRSSRSPKKSRSSGTDEQAVPRPSMLKRVNSQADRRISSRSPPRRATQTDKVKKKDIKRTYSSSSRDKTRVRRSKSQDDGRMHHTESISNLSSKRSGSKSSNRESKRQQYRAEEECRKTTKMANSQTDSSEDERELEALIHATDAALDAPTTSGTGAGPSRQSRRASRARTVSPHRSGASIQRSQLTQGLSLQPESFHTSFSQTTSGGMCKPDPLASTWHSNRRNVLGRSREDLMKELGYSAPPRTCTKKRADDVQKEKESVDDVQNLSKTPMSEAQPKTDVALLFKMVTSLQEELTELREQVKTVPTLQEELQALRQQVKLLRGERGRAGTKAPTCVTLDSDICTTPGSSSGIVLPITKHVTRTPKTNAKPADYRFSKAGDDDLHFADLEEVPEMDGSEMLRIMAACLAMEPDPSTPAARRATKIAEGVSDAALTLGKSGVGLVVGTRKAATDVVVGTGKVATDVVVGTGKVGMDVVKGTVNAGKTGVSVAGKTLRMLGSVAEMSLSGSPKNNGKCNPNRWNRVTPGEKAHPSSLPKQMNDLDDSDDDDFSVSSFSSPRHVPTATS